MYCAAGRRTILTPRPRSPKLTHRDRRSSEAGAFEQLRAQLEAEHSAGRRPWIVRLASGIALLTRAFVTFGAERVATSDSRGCEGHTAVGRRR